MNATNKYLYKMGFYHSTEISDNEIDVDHLPEDVIYNNHMGQYYKINLEDATDTTIEQFLKVKNAYNLNIIKNCVIVFTVFIIIAVALLCIGVL